MYPKEQGEKVVQSTIAGEFSLPWWSSQSQQGSQSAHGDNHFTFPSDSEDGQKIPQAGAAVSGQAMLQGSQPCFELPYAQQIISAKYPYADQFYGLFSSTYGPHIAGRVMLPISMSTDEGPIYVNAKQYHGIMRRRKSRAKAEIENKVLRARKPYLHESRHLHAIRRARGIGGRFVGTRNTSDTTKSLGRGIKQNSTNGQLVTTINPTLSNLNPATKSTNSGRLSLSGTSEVTRTYPAATKGSNFSISQINGPPHPSVCSLANAMGTLGWTPSPGNCFNLRV